MSQDAAPLLDLLRIQREIVDRLESEGQIDMAVTAGDTMRKFFVMSCGSYFEDWITADLSRVARQCAGEAFGMFLVNKALKRQYHTLFGWGDKNINSFLKLFGDPARDRLNRAISSNDERNSSARSRDYGGCWRSS